MINYIKSDLYRNLNKLSFWICTVILSIISVSITLIINDINKQIPSVTLNSASIALPYAFMAVVYILIFYIEIITGDEKRNKTLKNVVSYGISRNTVAISKLISTTIIAIISAIIVLSIFSISILIFFRGEKYLLIEFIKRVLIAGVLWLGAISFGTFLYLVFNGSISVLIYIFTFLLSKNVINLLIFLVSDKFKYINEILISNRLTIVASEPLTMNNVTSSLLVGIGYIVVFTGLSMLYLKNKEIR